MVWFPAFEATRAALRIMILEAAASAESHPHLPWCQWWHGGIFDRHLHRSGLHGASTEPGNADKTLPTAKLSVGRTEVGSAPDHIISAE